MTRPWTPPTSPRPNGAARPRVRRRRQPSSPTSYRGGLHASFIFVRFGSRDGSAGRRWPRRRRRTASFMASELYGPLVAMEQAEGFLPRLKHEWWRGRDLGFVLTEMGCERRRDGERFPIRVGLRHAHEVGGIH